MGEKFVKIPGQPIYGRTKVRTCPICGWQGLVIPRLGIGCPDHGVWYKDDKEKQTYSSSNNGAGDQLLEKEEEQDDNKPKRSERRDMGRRGAPHRAQGRYG